MTSGNIKVVSKKAWSKIIWEQAWVFDDADWRASNIVLQENDLLSLTIGNTHHLTLWKISDMDHKYIKMCETMSKMICRASAKERLF